MQAVSIVEKLFTSINQSADILAEELHIPYIEAVAETGENLFSGEILQKDSLPMDRFLELEKLYKEISETSFNREDLRKAYQLLILKGLKDASHSNHQMTPDTVGLLVGYLISKFYEKEPNFTLLDPAVGTGNLLTTVLNQQTNKQIESIGIDVDDLLLKLAYIQSNLQQHTVQFFNQDSLSPLYVDPVDAVICDLPIGYYPNDEGAKAFQLKAEDGHSFAHHLFIEQSITYTKPGGYLFFIVPNSLFESSEAKKLNEYLKQEVYIQGFLQLPVSMFKQSDQAKSILILQKQGDDVTPPKQAMLVNLPKLSNVQAMQSILSQIETWLKENKH